MQKDFARLEKNDQDRAHSKNENKDTSSNGASGRIVTQHIESFLENNLEAVLSDYTSESVLITEEAIYTGTEEIRAFFSGLITHFPRQTSKMSLEKMVVDDTLVFIVWRAKTSSLEVPFASDTFIVKEGKIHRQTFVGQLKFIRQ